MGTMRKALNPQTSGRIALTITGDHVHRPVKDIEQLIAGS